MHSKFSGFLYWKNSFILNINPLSQEHQLYLISEGTHLLFRYFEIQAPEMIRIEYSLCATYRSLEHFSTHIMQNIQIPESAYAVTDSLISCILSTAIQFIMHLAYLCMLILPRLRQNYNFFWSNR